MNRPDFREVKKLLKAIDDINAGFQSIYNDRNLQEKNIKTLCNRIAEREARKALFDISVEELKNARAGIRIQALLDAGYVNLGKIGGFWHDGGYYASPLMYICN